MGLKLYNSLTRRREEFVPIHPPRVGFYKCGMTVYGPAHLGHAKSGVHFDVMVRWLRYRGYDVNYVQNITDVGHLTNDSDDGEDPMVREARRRGLHPMAVAEKFTRDWLDDMDALNLVRPDIMPRASGHITEQIELAETLIAKGHAYVVDGSVYFDVASFPAYGQMSGRTVSEQESGTRVETRSEKRHPADFALWKRADAGHLMQWRSPWGLGYPGWHLECSAMGIKYLGESFDIHGGGLDNQFPHHECEIAQSECATGKPFVRYWLHNNMCTVNGQKMAKSLGNGIAVQDILRRGHALLAKTFDAAVVRHFILTSHYRATLDFSNDALAASESGSHKIRDALRELTRAAANAPSAAERPVFRASVDAFQRRFGEAMDEDFNTAAAIAVLFEFVRETPGWLAGGLSREDLQHAAVTLRGLTADALGFEWPAAEGAAAAEKRAHDVIGLLVELRKQARQNKNFPLSDQIRDGLAALGVELRDGPQGTTW